MLLEDVVREFDELGVHAVHDAVGRARHDAHDLVDELRMRFDDPLEGFAGQRHDVRIGEGSQPDGVRGPVDEAQLTGQLAVTQDGEAHVVVGPGALHDLDLARHDNVETIVDLALAHKDDEERSARIQEAMDDYLSTRLVEHGFQGDRDAIWSTLNIDIVLNELDALVNIDLSSRTPRPGHRALNLILP